MESPSQATCKTCGKTLSPLNMLRPNRRWETDFCSKECWVKSEDYTLSQQKFLDFWKSLSEFQRKKCKAMFVFILDVDFEYELRKWLGKVKIAKPKQKRKIKKH